MTTTETILAACFWCSAAGVVYAYLGYPALIYGLSRIFGKAPSPPVVTEIQLPRVALLIVAYNEAAVIEQRIHNALALEYPRDRLDIVIASDGSDDDTAEICRRYSDRVRLLAFQNRRGKAATLNAALPRLVAPIVVLSDANTSMDPSALSHLARWFADPRVGAVCGRLVLSDPRTGRNADSVYWKYETFLKRCEGRLDGLLGANGAIYAIRRELFEPLPRGTLIDDFMVPLAAKLRSGCRIVYDATAVASEETAPDIRGEFNRRSRIGAGGFESLRTLWPLLNPLRGWVALTLWSHKVLRWVCPLLLVVALLAPVALIRHPVYAAAMAAQALFYGLCILGAILPAANRACRLVRVFPMFAGMNLALLMGFFRWLRGTQTGIWIRTARAADAALAGPARSDGLVVQLANMDEWQSRLTSTFGMEGATNAAGTKAVVRFGHGQVEPVAATVFDEQTTGPFPLSDAIEGMYQVVTVPLGAAAAPEIGSRDPDSGEGLVAGRPGPAVRGEADLRKAA